MIRSPADRRMTDFHNEYCFVASEQWRHQLCSRTFVNLSETGLLLHPCKNRKGQSKSMMVLIFQNSLL